MSQRPVFALRRSGFRHVFLTVWPMRPALPRGRPAPLIKRGMQTCRWILLRKRIRADPLGLPAGEGSRTLSSGTEAAGPPCGDHRPLRASQWCVGAPDWHLGPSSVHRPSVPVPFAAGPVSSSTAKTTGCPLALWAVRAKPRRRQALLRRGFPRSGACEHAKRGANLPLSRRVLPRQRGQCPRPAIDEVTEGVVR